MSVPTSGKLYGIKLAKEKVYDDYNSSAPNPIGPIRISDLVQGGNINGSGTYFDETDTNSPSYPTSTPPYRASHWHGYDHDYTPIFVDAVSQTSSRLYIPSHSATKPYEQQSRYQQGGVWYNINTAPYPQDGYLGWSGTKNYSSSNTPDSWYVNEWVDPFTSVGLNRRNRVKLYAVSTPNWSYNYILYTKFGYKFSNLSTSSTNILVTSAYLNTDETIMAVYFTIQNTGNFTLGSAILNIDFDIIEA